MQPSVPTTWDIFCRVIDNYGDIGVCWRLARQLANEYPFQVRLWVDELPALTQIWPGAENTTQQQLENVDVRRWTADFDNTIEPADVVIEAFACEIPSSYLMAMKAKTSHTHWFNLEYLSAEDWVEGCHGLLSPHPQLGLKKAFFFPGFTLKTGGLIKERELFRMRDSFLEKKTNQLKLLEKIDTTPSPDELLISLFGYENSAVASLINAWIVSPIPVLCLLPTSKILTSVNIALGRALKLGDSFVSGNLHLKVIPFLSQAEYDQLLWMCDINFVRGEDSFVRAQWAAKPFIWHIYPQEDNAHTDKLNAFLSLYLQGVREDVADAIGDLWRQWNSAGDPALAWNKCLIDRQKWLKHSQNWSLQLNSLGDLASNMVQFCQKTL